MIPQLWTGSCRAPSAILLESVTPGDARDSAFPQDLASKGSGIDKLSAALWCSKCLDRMPGPQAKHIRTQLE